MGPTEDLDRATALYRAGNRTAAAAAAELILARAPTDPPTLNLLAVIAMEEGHAAKAEHLAERALNAGGPDAIYLNTLGNALMAQGRTAEALTAFVRAREHAPADVDVLFNLANAQGRAGHTADAVASYRACISLKPGYVAAHNNLALLLKAQGDLDGAVNVLTEAIAHAPKSAKLRFNLGNAYQAAGRLEAAESAYRRALELKPGHADAQVNLGVVLAESGRKTEAETAFRRAIALNPDLAPAYVGLADLGDEGGDGIAHRRAVLAMKPDLAAIRSSLLMCLHYSSAATRHELFAEHLAYGRLFAAPAAPASRRAGPASPLRLGVVSGDFRFHAMRFFALPVFAARDRAAWHLTCYSTTARPDDHTQAFRAAADDWRDVRSLSADQLEALIRRDEIDILIDLSGHAPHNRLPVFARKPAALQVAWGDYVDTRGLAAIDILLGDAIHTPPAEDRFYTERVVRFAPDYICYAPPDYAPAVSPLPACANGRITFACFSEVTKVDGASVASWAAVLKAVPDARMLLNNHLFADAPRRARVTELFGAEGVQRDRLIFRTGGMHAEFLAQYADADVVLDTAPYSGGLTTCEALLMGVPVLTIPGDRFCGRHACAHLTHGAYPDGVARDLPDLIAKACALAADLPALTKLRTALRPRLLASTVCDVGGFAGRFYDTLQREWLALPVR